jgi:2-polyprenyl-6-methoxyphenol hydroxylase-like FAD-dependent oxidoreductase
MPAPLRIAIVGHGIAGIAAAQLLRRQGHDIEHFERAASTETTGAGLLLQPPTLRLLQRMRLLDAVARRGARVSCIRAETVAGRRVMRLRYEEHAPGDFALGIQRTALVDAMRAEAAGAQRVNLGCEIVAVDAAQGVLHDAQRREFGPFDVVIAADGANSRVRQQLPGLVRRDREYPWKALVCVVDDPLGVAGDCVAQGFEGSAHVSWWPVGARYRGGPPTMNLSLKLPPGCASAGHTLGAWKQRIARLGPALAPLLAAAHDDTPMLPYAYRDVALRTYTAGRVVLLGDAAHSMSPQLGQGVRLALEDAWDLAAALRQLPPAAALSSFARRRARTVQKLQRISRWLTPLFQSDSPLLSQCRDRIFGPLLELAVARRLGLALLCEDSPGWQAMPLQAP